MTKQQNIKTQLLTRMRHCGTTGLRLLLLGGRPGAFWTQPRRASTIRAGQKLVELGAIGIHYVNGDLAGDGMVEAARPEALIDELADGGFRLVGVEYMVDAATWL